jgi:hypothetical protein
MPLNKTETARRRALEAVCRREGSQRSETGTPPRGMHPPPGHALQERGAPFGPPQNFKP